ncbi:unnamed protein product [Pedinophyceae sp. YPF-701]|nr:unnamed protein product [Pedinophyceae sp. YPF-701]
MWTTGFSCLRPFARPESGRIGEMLVVGGLGSFGRARPVGSREPPAAHLLHYVYRCRIRGTMSAIRSSIPTAQFARKAVAAKPAARSAVVVKASLKEQAAKAAVAAAAALSVAGGAMAEVDLELGQQVFEGNCAACHAGGGNSVIPDHTLAKSAIEQFLDGGYNIEAITYQVQNGKGAMPAWAGRLTDEEIDSVSAYVYKQAGEGW